MPTTPEPRPRSDREAELISAAAAGELSPEEAEEYAALVAADPGAAAEAEELRALLARLDEAPPTWTEPVPSPGLAARVLAIPATERQAPAAARRGSRLTRWLPAAAAAVVLLLVGGVAGTLLGDRDEQPPQGPPGTLGAVEPIVFEAEPEGVDIEASLVAHTWGTETVLDMDGWTEGASYQVLLIGNDGTVEDSGTFLGSQVPIVCRMNAALLREQVDLVEIRDSRGRVVARSDVPSVSS